MSDNIAVTGIYESSEDSAIGRVVRSIDRDVERRHIERVIGVFAGVSHDIRYFRRKVEPSSDRSSARRIYIALFA